MDGQDDIVCVQGVERFVGRMKIKDKKKSVYYQYQIDMKSIPCFGNCGRFEVQVFFRLLQLHLMLLQLHLAQILTILGEIPQKRKIQIEGNIVILEIDCKIQLLFFTIAMSQIKEPYFNKFHNFQYNRRSYVVQKKTIFFPNDSNHTFPHLWNITIFLNTLYSRSCAKHGNIKRSQEQTRKNARSYDARQFDRDPKRTKVRPS